jgi:Zn-finger nucleic acid-binding protein
MSNKKTTQEFINSGKKVHGDKYDYSLANYINAKTKIKIICSKHGIFEQIPRQHISGYNCPKCSGVYMDTQYFLEKSNNTHNFKYDYSKVHYEKSTKPVIIKCQIHGNFKQKPKDHLLGKGCPKCAGKNKNTGDFISESKKIHGDKYDYLLANYINAKTKIKIICPLHGVFEQTPNSHLNGKGCPICKISKGERKIRNLLINKNIEFIPQKKFNKCKNIKELPFDFYLPKYNTCIEYHGEQHYKIVKHFGGKGKFKKLKENDAIKLKFCLENKINLIIISKLNDIENFIDFL